VSEDATRGAELLERLRAFEGVETGPGQARDPVNEPMIRHWCDAVGDRNPVYTDPEFAAASVHGGIVAPPTMLQAWTMPGLLPREELEARLRARGGVMQLLDEAGFTSVVATNCTQEYRRYLRPGDRLSVTQSIESVSDEKQTALGRGHFVTQRLCFRDQRGEEVAVMRFRMLKFEPKQAAPRPSPGAAAPPRTRPRPALTHDNRFFWEGIEAGVLRIQRCAGCGRLRHPPGPMCPSCHSLDWDAIESSGRGTLYSYVVAHHPPIPPFAYPNPIALVELEEGTRIVANLIGVERAAIRVGMPLRAEFPKVEAGRRMLQFRPA
jgi:uncharacterized OB-fold protein/acyl dehydratase